MIQTIVLEYVDTVDTRGRIRFEFEMVFEWTIFGLFLNRIFESNRIFYMYCNRVRIRRQSQSSEKKEVRDSTYALCTSKNIRSGFEMIFECRKIRKTLKFSNFESNIFSNPTPSRYFYTIGSKLRST
jgi:hypothetical protein